MALVDDHVLAGPLQMPDTGSSNTRELRIEDRCAIGGEAPRLSLAITNLNPAERRNNPSVHA
jgi:hypothetical protein